MIKRYLLESIYTKPSSPSFLSLILTHDCQHRCAIVLSIFILVGIRPAGFRLVGDKPQVCCSWMDGYADGGMHQIAHQRVLAWASPVALCTYIQSISTGLFHSARFES